MKPMDDREWVTTLMKGWGSACAGHALMGNRELHKELLEGTVDSIMKRFRPELHSTKEVEAK